MWGVSRLFMSLFTDILFAIFLINFCIIIKIQINLLSGFITKSLVKNKLRQNKVHLFKWLELYVFDQIGLFARQKALIISDFERVFNVVRFENCRLFLWLCVSCRFISIYYGCMTTITLHLLDILLIFIIIVAKQQLIYHCIILILKWFNVDILLIIFIFFNCESVFHFCCCFLI